MDHAQITLMDGQVLDVYGKITLTEGYIMAVVEDAENPHNPPSKYIYPMHRIAFANIQQGFMQANTKR